MKLPQITSIIITKMIEASLFHFKSHRFNFLPFLLSLNLQVLLYFINLKKKFQNHYLDHFFHYLNLEFN